MQALATLLIPFLGVLTTLVPTAYAEKRIALVVGIDAYVQVPKLEKAVNDARAVGDTLETVGFTVLRAENVSRRDLNQRLVEFAARLDPGDEAVFYFAGHGVEIDGRNYLFAADVPRVGPGQEEFVKSEGVAVDRVMDIVRGRGARVSLLILDACRDNPFEREGTRSLGASRGLGATPAPEGAFILYSAGIGQTALDRLSDSDTDPNSVFTRKLVPLMRESGLPLVEAARRLRQEVQQLARTVAHDQRPAYYDEVTGQFYFTPGERAAAADSRPHTPPPPAAPPSASEPAPSRGSDVELAFWNAVKDSDNPSALQTYLDRFPDGVFAPLARLRIVEVEAARSAPPAPVQPDPPAQQAFAAPMAVLPHSSSIRLSPADVAGLDCDRLWIARNEIFHRRGYCFQTPRGRAYFDNSRCWTSSQDILGPVERANVTLLQSWERRQGCR